jgi:hypothetical protein
MAPLALEKAPFAAIFSCPLEGAGQPEPRAENHRERGEQEWDSRGELSAIGQPLGDDAIVLRPALRVA